MVESYILNRYINYPLGAYIVTSQTQTPIPTNVPAPLALRGLLIVVAIALICYSCLTVWSSLTGAMEHYTIHVSLIFMLVTAELMVMKFQANRMTAVFASLLFVTIAVSGVYFISQAKTLEFSQPFISSTDFVFGLILVFSILSVAWLVWGPTLALICIAAAAYFALGHLLPGDLATSRKYEPNLIVSYLAGMGGPRGVLNYAPLSADVIFLLLVYAVRCMEQKLSICLAKLEMQSGSYFAVVSLIRRPRQAS